MRKLIINNRNIVSELDVTTSILNIGAGRTLPLDFYGFMYPFLVNVDRNYLTGKSIESIEEHHNYFSSPLRKPVDGKSSCIYRCKYGVYEFLERYHNKFDLITMYRFLEHVEFTKVPYFIYLLSQIVRKEGLVDVIVPDYRNLAYMILNESTSNIDFEYKNTLLTTELLNEPCDPHASIWTEDRLKYFFLMEKRFITEDLIKNFELDGRNIYIRAIFRRV